MLCQQHLSSRSRKKIAGIARNSELHYVEISLTESVAPQNREGNVDACRCSAAIRKELSDKPCLCNGTSRNPCLSCRRSHQPTETDKEEGKMNNYPIPAMRNKMETVASQWTKDQVFGLSGRKLDDGLVSRLPSLKNFSADRIFSDKQCGIISRPDVKGLSIPFNVRPEYHETFSLSSVRLFASLRGSALGGCSGIDGTTAFGGGVADDHSAGSRLRTHAQSS